MPRRQHHTNSLFRGARSLSPSTNNLIAMKMIRKDWTAFSHEKADIFIKQSEICCDDPDQQESISRFVF